jgi:predicted small secreted protein
MKNFRLIALACCVSALSACNTVDGFVEDIKFTDWGAYSGRAGGKSENLLSDGCPVAGIVPDLGTYSEFTNNNAPTNRTLVSQAHMGDIQSKCDYGPQSVTVDIKINFDGVLGPAGTTSSSFSYPFFVAVTSPTGTILAKEIFSANMNYNSGSRQSYQETMRQIIPIQNKESGQYYKVLAGFQLTPEQLGYNRAVIESEKAAAKERARIEREAVKAAKENASTEPAEVIVVPAAQMEEGPIVIAPNR